MSDAPHLAPAYRDALLVAAALNLVMFVVEGGVGLRIGSAALLADAVDFLEDAGGYGLALLALTWSARRRAEAGLVMGAAMMLVGLSALWQVVARLLGGGAPAAEPMALTALLALTVNVYCAYRLAPFRSGDASMRSIWLSTRNDAVLNLTTIAAAGLVLASATAWPDLAAGLLIAGINLWASVEIIGQAWRERGAARR